MQGFLTKEVDLEKETSRGRATGQAPTELDRGPGRQAEAPGRLLDTTPGHEGEALPLEQLAALEPLRRYEDCGAITFRSVEGFQVPLELTERRKAMRKRKSLPNFVLQFSRQDQRRFVEAVEHFHSLVNDLSIVVSEMKRRPGKKKLQPARPGPVV